MSYTESNSRARNMHNQSEEENVGEKKPQQDESNTEVVVSVLTNLPPSH